MNYILNSPHSAEMALTVHKTTKCHVMLACVNGLLEFMHLKTVHGTA